MIYWVFAAIVALFVYAGARAGLRLALIKTLASVGAVVFSALLTPLVLTALQDFVNPVFIWVGAGLSIFFATAVLLNRVLHLALPPMALPAVWNSSLGALLNSLSGLIVALCVVWTLTNVGGVLRLLDNKALGLPLNPLQQAAAWSLQQWVVLSGRAGGLPAPTAHLWGAVAAQPSEYIADAKSVVQQPAFLQALHNPECQTLLQQQAFAALKNQPIIQSLLNSSPWQAAENRLTAAGVLSADNALFTAFSVFYQGLVTVLMDAEIKRFLQHPEVAEKLANGDYLGLTLHPGFNTALARAEFLVKQVLGQFSV